MIYLRICCVYAKSMPGRGADKGKKRKSPASKSEHILSIYRAHAAQRQRILVPSVPLLVSKILLRNRLSLYSVYVFSGVFRGIFWSLDRMIRHMFRRCWTYT